jgi:glycosyltransferase involved in cell wall biosynthesis
VPVSVLILTRDEEANLPDCLASVTWSDDVVVFDSYSSDRTIEIAMAAGARVMQRKFDDFGSQREAARLQGAFRHPWLLVLDADERPDQKLIDEIQSIARNPSNTHAAYRMRRKDYFLGKWIKYSTLYPSWFVRFLRPERVRYEARAVHEYPTVDGMVGSLEGHLLHYSFNKGLEPWLNKHATYASLEARENLAHLKSQHVHWAGLLSTDPVRRRRALKGLSFRLPFRPGLRFLYMYVLRGGILDGSAGYTYCRLLSSYERMIVRELEQLQHHEAGPSV